MFKPVDPVVKEMVLMLFGEYVRKKRREKKLSIRLFAEQVGISPRFSIDWYFAVSFQDFSSSCCRACVRSIVL